MTELFKIAAGITSPWGLSAFAVAAVVYIAARRRGKVPPVAWICILVLVLAPILASVYAEVRRTQAEATAIYRVRVTVLDPRHMPAEDAQVHSSVGGEPKKVEGGWQFDIPTASRPMDDKLTIYAALPSAFLSGKRDLHLGEDYNPSVTVQLEADTSAQVRGIVVDGLGTAVPAARVSVVGYEAEAVITSAGGNFVLPAHAADGQQVRLHAEKKGYSPADQWHPAGAAPATVLLERK